MNSLVALKNRVRTNTGRYHDQLGNFSDEARQNFIQQVWPGEDTTEVASPLLRHYIGCCAVFFLGPFSYPLSQRSNADVAALVKLVKENKTRDDILQFAIDLVHQNHAADDCKKEDESIAEQLMAIALKTSLMCSVDVGKTGHGQTDLNERHISWDAGDVKSLLKDSFPNNNKLEGTGKLERTFHARNLERFGSIQVKWTDNLLDHLRLQDPAKEGKPFRVSIFHHARFLRQCENTDIFPPGFASETLKTLALLFPGQLGGTISWFKQQADYKDLDIAACYCDALDYEHRSLESFDFWRDRLTILKQTYDESEPKTVFQWWNDGRKRERWATFWVAILVLILTIFFGLIQCVEGGIQVYKAYHPS